MESNQDTLNYGSKTMRHSVLAVKDKLPSPPRSTSLMGISHYQENYNSFSDPYYGTYNHHDSNLRSSYITSSSPPEHVHRDIYSRRKFQSRNGEIFKENLPNHVPQECDQFWLCDIDKLKQKVRRDSDTNKNQNKDLIGKCTRSCCTNGGDREYHRPIRTRSESEPNDISSMKQLPVMSIKQNGLKPEEYKDREYQNLTSVDNKSQSKRESPPKVLIYNNTCHSPAVAKKSNRIRTTTGLNSPRMNLLKKSKAKSSSPPSATFRGRTLVSSSLRSNPSILPNKSLIGPLETKRTENNVQKDDEKSDTEGSSLEDDDDFDDINGSTFPQSSDSESGGYKKKMNNIHNLLDHSPSPNTELKCQYEEKIENPKSPFAISLFPNVPPYLAFSTHLQKGPAMPTQLHKILKWKLTTIMPRVVRRIVINSGFRLLKKTNDWMGTWGKHMKSPLFKTVRSYQKINHIPGSFKIGRKDCCWRNLQAQMAKHGKDEFGFMPRTYVMPQDLKALRKAWPKYSQRNFKWIIKPPASARGTGIKVINRWSQIPKRRPVIVQRYIEKPFLINGSKFDLRIYVLVTSLNPLRIYMYKDGLARFASVKYSEKSDTLSDRCMHLTNYSINKLSSNYSRNDDANACQGHKWTLKSLWSYLHERGVNTNRLWGALRNLVLRTILAGENSINSIVKMNIESKYNCFELFGFDVILDSELVPWLLEVNISPSLHSDLPLDLHVKAPLVQAVLNTALYHIPPKLTEEQQKEVLDEHGLQEPLCFDKRMYVTYLSRAEKLKHSQFTRKSLEDREDYLNSILENLTPDDIRCLVVSEDELARSKPLERIFPGPNTHKYLKYTETPRYYNRLLDAWETRYSKDRNAGIKLLQDLCAQKLHLDVPQTPVKKLLKIRTRTLRGPSTIVSSMTTAITTTTIIKTKAVKKPNMCWALSTAVNSIKRRNKNRLLKKTTNKSQNHSKAPKFTVSDSTVEPETKDTLEEISPTDANEY